MIQCMLVYYSIEWKYILRADSTNLLIVAGDPKDIFTFVNLLYLRGEYHRAEYFIQTNRLHITFYGAYLIAKVLYSN